MSRIGRKPVVLPSGVTVEPGPGTITVKGPKGDLTLDLPPDVEVGVDAGSVSVSPVGSARRSRAYHGLARALISNMVKGVTQGYQKTLEIHGVGWNAEVKGRKVGLNIGFANTVEIDFLPRTEVICPSPDVIVVSGTDKQAVGQLAARIRSIRPPEPYKGKGIRYRGEYVRQKAGKTFGSATT